MMPGQAGFNWDNGKNSLFRRALSRFSATFEDEADRWFLWLPVVFGIGIGIYFAFRQDPAS